MLGRFLRVLLMVLLAVSIAGQPAYAGKKKSKAPPHAAEGKGESKGGEGKEGPPPNPNVTVANIPSMARPEFARGPTTMVQNKVIFPVRQIEKMRIPSIFE